MSALLQEGNGVLAGLQTLPKTSSSLCERKMPRSALQVSASTARVGAGAGSSHRPADTHTPAVPTLPLLWSNHLWYDAPGAAFDLLMGRSGYRTGVDEASAVMFWHNEVARSGAIVDAAVLHHRFTLKMCDEALGRAIVPPPDEGQPPKRVWLTGASADDKGKGRAEPMDEDEDEDEERASTSSEGGGDGWGGLS